MLFNISKARYEECLKDDNIASLLINNSKEIGRYPGIGVPKFFINEKEYNSAYSYEELSKAIESESKK